MATKVQAVREQSPSVLSQQTVRVISGVKSKSRRKPGDINAALPNRPDVAVAMRVPVKPQSGRPQNHVKMTATKVHVNSVTSAGKLRVTSASSSRQGSVNKTRQLSAKPVIDGNDLPNGGGDTVDSDEDDDGVMLINIPSESEQQSRESARPSRPIEPEDILAVSQETQYGQVFQIDLHAAQVSHIHNLEKFTRVRILDLSCNCIQRIDKLDCLQEVRELKLYDNYISIIEGLEKLKELCHLQLQHNRIKSVGKGLANLKRLKILRLDGNYLLKLEPREMTGCSLLTSLDISNNKLDNLSAVNCLPCLEELYAANNRIRSLVDLSRCKRLQEVDLSGNKLQDLSGLKGLSNLTIVRACSNALSSVRTLGKMKRLEELYVANNRVTDTSHVVALFPALQILDVANNHLETWEQVSCLSSLQDLVEVALAGNPFCNETGPVPQYHTELPRVLPSLEVVDGILLKRPSSRGGTPLMRPMTASSVMSTRQMESQLQFIQDEMNSFESSLTSKFDQLRVGIHSLGPEPSSRPGSISADSMRSASAGSNRPTSRCGKRSRIQEAIEFASQQ